MNDVFASFDFLTFSAWAIPVLVLYQVSHQIGRVVGAFERMAERQSDQLDNLGYEMSLIRLGLADIQEAIDEHGKAEQSP